MLFIGNLVYVLCLLTNALAILSDDRFLARIGLSTSTYDPAFGAGADANSVKAKLVALIASVRMVMRRTFPAHSPLWSFYPLSSHLGHYLYWALFLHCWRNSVAVWNCEADVINSAIDHSEHAHHPIRAGTGLVVKYRKPQFSIYRFRAPDSTRSKRVPDYCGTLRSIPALDTFSGRFTGLGCICKKA